jgi:hypothetical protein
MNTLVSHPGQVTIFKLPLVLMALCVRTGPTGPGSLPDTDGNAACQVCPLQLPTC